MGSDRDVWAKGIANWKKRQGFTNVDLEPFITSITATDTIHGSSSMEIQIYDQDWKLTDTGFFDANKDGRLDAIEVNYPDGSDLWWRLTQVGIDAAQDATITMTFMERAAVNLMAHRGPKKVSRAKRTRAEFIKGLVDEVKAHGGITFHCSELHVKQEVQPDDPSEVKRRKKDATKARKDKDAGFAEGTVIKYKDFNGSEVTLTNDELGNAAELLQEAYKHTTHPRPLLALLEAAIVEGPNFDNNPVAVDHDSIGILQARRMNGTDRQRMSIAWNAMSFLTEQAGGAIKIAKDNPGWSPGQIAYAVQRCAAQYAGRYEQVRDGADKVLEAYGGGSGIDGTANTYRQQYNFEIGTTTEPFEDYWTGINRLAEEVNWAFFLDGPDAYYDSEPMLVAKQKPVAIIRRGDPWIGKFTTNWDARQIATEATVEVICEPFEFRAGEVFKLDGFGPASTGSSLKKPMTSLPGRWLISETQRDVFAEFTTFTLKQPEIETMEPAAALVDRANKNGSDGGSADPLALGDGVTNGTLLWPVTPHSNITGRFGEQRPGHRHDGIDIAVPVGTDVVAADGGKVTVAGPNGAYGTYIEIEHDNGVVTFYGHLSRIMGPMIQVGSKVSQGQKIALSGNTGRSTGPHLHFGLHINGQPRDPLPLLKNGDAARRTLRNQNASKSVRNSR